MIDIFNKIIDYFLDKEKSFGSKTKRIIFIVFALIVFDISMDISYNIHLSNKISQLDKIHSLKNNYVNDTLKYTKLDSIETKILDKNHYFDNVKNFIESLKFDKLGKLHPENKTRSLFWMIISSNLVFLLIWLTLLFLPLFNFGKNSKIWGGWMAMNIIWGALLSIYTIVIYQIPVLIYPFINYIVNIIIQSIIIYVLFSSIKKSK